MRAVVPFDAASPKRRLDPVLSPEEREAFARAMLEDVLRTLRAVDGAPVVVSTAPIKVPVPVEIDERPLDTVVADAIESGVPLAVVMADLPLLDSQAMQRLLEPEADVVLAPGRGGGTNAMVIRDAAFEPDYHGASIRDHRQVAADRGLSVATVDSFRLATDVDEPPDLVEVLLHGTGRASEWLDGAGFTLETNGGRVGVDRDR